MNLNKLKPKILRMAKYYPCYTTSAPVGDHGTYYVCSREAYEKKDALRVLKYNISGDSRAGGSTLLIKKVGPFGWFSRFPDSYWDIFYRSNMLNEVNTKEELEKDKVNKDKVNHPDHP